MSSSALAPATEKEGLACIATESSQCTLIITIMSRSPTNRGISSGSLQNLPMSTLTLW